MLLSNAESFFKVDYKNKKKNIVFNISSGKIGGNCAKGRFFFQKGRFPNFILLKHLMLKLNFSLLTFISICSHLILFKMWTFYVKCIIKKKIFYKSIYNGKNSIHRNNFSFNQLSTSSK